MVLGFLEYMIALYALYYLSTVVNLWLLLPKVVWGFVCTAATTVAAVLVAFSQEIFEKFNMQGYVVSVGLIMLPAFRQPLGMKAPGFSVSGETKPSETPVELFDATLVALFFAILVAFVQYAVPPVVMMVLHVLAFLCTETSFIEAVSSRWEERPETLGLPLLMTGLLGIYLGNYYTISAVRALHVKAFSGMHAAVSVLRPVCLIGREEKALSASA